MSLKDNIELYKILKLNYGLGKGPIRILRESDLQKIQGLFLTNMFSLDGIEELSNLSYLKCLLNQLPYDLNSYLKVVTIPHINIIEYNIPHVRFFPLADVVEAHKNIKFNITNSLYYDGKCYNGYELALIQKQLNKIKNMVNQKTTPLAKVKLIYQEIGRDLEVLTSKHSDIYNDWSILKQGYDNLWGCLIKKRANVNGIVLSLKTVLKDNGFEVEICNGFDRLKEPSLHQWNQVKIGQKWYNLDLTFDALMQDNFKKGEWRHFLKSDYVFIKTHVSNYKETKHPYNKCRCRQYDNLDLTLDDLKKKREYLMGVKRVQTKLNIKQLLLVHSNLNKR